LAAVDQRVDDRDDRPLHGAQRRKLPRVDTAVAKRLEQVAGARRIRQRIVR
jgi:hypothetical protein